MIVCVYEKYAAKQSTSPIFYHHRKIAQLDDYDDDNEESERSLDEANHQIHLRHHPHTTIVSSARRASSPWPLKINIHGIRLDTSYLYSTQGMKSKSGCGAWRNINKSGQTRNSGVDVLYGKRQDQQRQI